MAYLQDTQHTRDVFDETYRIALMLYQDVRKGDGRAESTHALSEVFWTDAKALEPRLYGSKLAWDETVRAHVRDALVPRSTDDGAPRREYAALAARCVRVGLAVATGRQSELPQGLARWGADTLGRLGMGAQARRLRSCDRVVHAPRPVGEGVTFNVAVSSGRKPGEALRETYLVTGTCPVIPLTDAEAPVVARLKGSGAPVVVRRHGAGFLRPVLSPGGWDPMDLAAFRHAASSGGAWRDDPFADRRDPDRDLGTDERTTTPTRDTPHGRGLARSHEALALERAGTLHLVDGIVHRSCEAPRLALCERTDGYWQDSRVTVGWSLGDDLSSWTDVAVQRRETAYPHHRDMTHGVPLPPLDRATHEALRAVLPEIGPWSACHGAEWLDHDALGTGPEAGLEALCADLRADRPWRLDGQGAAIAAAAEAIADGVVPGEPMPRGLDACTKALTAMATVLANQVRDARHGHDAMATMTF